MLKTKKFKVAKNKIVAFCVCMMAGTAAYALPFNVVTKAGTTLPATFSTGGIATAYYTVTNLTNITRIGSFIKYLPPNVTQVTTGGTFPDTCPATFTLASGASCTLQLNITGPVNGNDPNQQNHLFVCTQGGLACAGPSPDNTLNVVEITPAVYVTNNSTSVLNYCVPSASGTFSNCQPTGSGFVNPIGMTLTPAGSSIYVVNTGSPIAAYQTGTISLCQLARSGAITNCTTTLSGLTIPAFLVINPLTNYAYISNFNAYSVSGYNAPNITYCHIAIDGSLNSCTAAFDTGTPLGMSGMAINNAGTIMYVSSHNTSNGVDRLYVCPIETSGIINPTCTIVTDPTITNSNPRGARLNKAGTFLYVANLATSTISVCPVNQTTGALSACMAVSGFANPYDITLTADGTHAYVANTNVGGTSTPNVSYCAVNATNGLLTGCIDSAPGTFTQPTGVLFR